MAELMPIYDRHKRVYYVNMDNLNYLRDDPKSKTVVFAFNNGSKTEFAYDPETTNLAPATKQQQSIHHRTRKNDTVKRTEDLQKEV